MTLESKNEPPPCEFRADKLSLEVDELVASDIEAISPLVDRLMRMIRQSHCAPGEDYALETALRESLANAILHGNRQNPHKRVRLCCACQEGVGILVVVKDEGEGFDPAMVPSPLLGQCLHSEHGRGIYPINLMMDAVEFRRGGREIYMRKGSIAQ